MACENKDIGCGLAFGFIGKGPCVDLRGRGPPSDGTLRNVVAPGDEPSQEVGWSRHRRQSLTRRRVGELWSP